MAHSGWALLRQMTRGNEDFCAPSCVACNYYSVRRPSIKLHAAKGADIHKVMVDTPTERSADRSAERTVLSDEPRTIALVDDDRNILTTVSIALQTEGYATRLYSDGDVALKAMLDNPPDLAVCDIKMPRMDGLELLRRLREKSDMPLIFLTSKDDEADEAFGLSMGADDYIAKPFSQRLLVARIKAILRRSDIVRREAEEEEQTGEPLPEPIRRGRLVMDPARHAVTWNNEAVSLTVTEFLILEALAMRPGVVKTRNQLMDAAYHDDVFVDDRTIDSHIKRLRRKFRAADAGFGAIETLYGAGYSFGDE